jgi:hypothetical protein
MALNISRADVHAQYSSLYTMLSAGYVAHRTKETPMTNHIAVLDELEARIAVAGLAGTEPQLRQIAEALVRTGTLPVIAGVIADADAPEPVRLRALARASRALRAMPSTEPRFLVVA